MEVSLLRQLKHLYLIFTLLIAAGVVSDFVCFLVLCCVQFPRSIVSVGSPSGTAQTSCLLLFKFLLN